MSALDLATGALFGVEASRALPVFALVAARTLPLAWLAPWLGWRGTAGAARVAIAVTLALALTPLALKSAPPLPDGWLPLALMGVREALIGASFAIAASVPLWALSWAGGLVDRWRGARSSDDAGPLETLHLGASVVLFVVLGGHRLALLAFADGLADAPVGAGASASDLSAFALGAGRIVTATLELAVAFAAPAAIAFVVLEIALGLASRAAPELRVFLDAMPLRAGLGIAVALLGLAAVLPRLPPLFASSIEAARELVRQMGASP